MPESTRPIEKKSELVIPAEMPQLSSLEVYRKQLERLHNGLEEPTMGMLDFFSLLTAGREIAAETINQFEFSSLLCLGAGKGNEPAHIAERCQGLTSVTGVDLIYGDPEAQNRAVKLVTDAANSDCRIEMRSENSCHVEIPKGTDIMYMGVSFHYLPQVEQCLLLQKAFKSGVKCIVIHDITLSSGPNYGYPLGQCPQQVATEMYHLCYHYWIPSLEKDLLEANLFNPESFAVYQKGFSEGYLTSLHNYSQDLYSAQFDTAELLTKKCEQAGWTCIFSQPVNPNKPYLTTFVFQNLAA